MVHAKHVITKALLCIGLVLLFSRCDIPTEGPDFSFETSVKAPLILDRTFVLLGPDESGFSALIDTTQASFDTLFSVEPSTSRLLINQDLDELEIGDLDDLISEISLDPISVGVSIGSLENQAFETETFGDEVGLFISPQIDLGAAPVNPSVPSYPIGNILVPPSVDLINLSGVTVESVRLSSATSNVNQFEFTLENGLASGSLTDGQGNPPLLILEQSEGGSTVEIAQVRFPSSPAPGQSVQATMSVSEALLRSDAVYRLEISTTEGDTPMTNNPTGVQLTTLVRPLEYAETGVTDIPAQSDIDASGDELSLGGETNFSGIVAAGGDITIQIENNLPFDVTLTEITVRNLSDVGTTLAPSIMLELDDLPAGTSTNIPEGQSVDLVFPLAGAVISSNIQVDVLASSPGKNSSAVIGDTDGLYTSVVGNVEVDELYFIPEAEVFTSEGLLEIDVDDVSFESGQEFVELESGTLMIQEITNQMNMDMEMLRFSLPGFRVAPYAESDSLVIQFSGASNNAGSFQFSQLSGETTLRDIPIDLSGVRIYPVNNEANYNVFALSEAGQPTSLNVSDQIIASLSPEALQVSKVSAIMSPTTIDLTDDFNGDGKLEVMSNQEAEVMDLGSLDALSDYDLDEFSFNGTQFTFNIDTNLGADIVFYAAMVGVKGDGSIVYLSGNNEFAVTADDTLASNFIINGSPVAPEDLMKFVIPGAPSADQVVTQVVEINSTNSNIDDFISAIPEEFRYVGKGLVQGMNGGLVQLQKPFTIAANISAGIPLSFSGSFGIDETMEADLSSLEDFTNDDSDVTINEGSLLLEYTTGLPVGVDLQVEFLNAAGQVVATMPDSAGTSFKLAAAAVNEAGMTTATETDMLEIGVTEAQLRAMSAGTQARLNLRINTNDGVPATLRSTDTIQIRLLGKFDLSIEVN
ncbi:MAG: hypothetical protein AB8G77_07265 [Rhodothermales bacterium]